MNVEAVRAYDRATRDLHETELRIASIERRNVSGTDAKILPSLIAKRDRLINQVIELKPERDAATVERFTSRAGTHIQFAPPRVYPIGHAPAYSGPDLTIPDFLRRVRA